MPFNGSGTFSRVYNWVTDKNNSVNITASRVDTEDTGFATGLSNCICKDGQTTITANLPMGGFKHTGVANGSAVDDYAALGQVQKNSFTWCGFSGGTVSNLTLTPTPAITAYTTGQRFQFQSTGTNTGAATVNVSGLGVKNIKKEIGGAVVSTVANDIINATTIDIIYDGTQFILLTKNTYSHGADVASATTTVLDTTTGDLVDVTGTTSITAITLAEGRQCTVRFTGILTLANGASLILPTGADITTATGDTAVFRGYASGVVRCISYNKINGLPVLASEGTFTPTVLGSSTAGTTTYTTQLGIYKKIGNIYFFQIYLLWTNQTGTGNLLVGNLPASAANNTGGYPASMYQSNVAGGAGKYIGCVVRAASTLIEFYNYDPTGAAVATSIDTAGEIVICGFYMV